MLNIRRLYNKNRILIWLIIIIVIFCISIINLVNLAYQEQAEKNSEKTIERIQEKAQRKSPSNIIDYDKAANSLTAGGSVSKDIRDDIQKTLEQFIQYISKNQLQEAYELLTEDCKRIKYPTLESFNQNYCQNILGKTYSFQSWSSTNNIYVYQVKFMEDMLSSGLDTSKQYIQDYITVINMGGKYKLNVNNIIKVQDINKVGESQQIQIKINTVETYLDYEIYEIEVKNDSLKEIILDTRQIDNSTYVTNNDGLKIRALLYENKEEELKISAGKTQKLKIKFNNTFNGEKQIINIGFSDIIYDQKVYQNDEQHKKGKMELEIYLR